MREQWWHRSRISSVNAVLQFNESTQQLFFQKLDNIIVKENDRILWHWYGLEEKKNTLFS